MGQVKHAAMEFEELGYSPIYDKSLCRKCISEPDIQSYIKRNGESGHCDYCNKSRRYTIEFNDFMEFFTGKISQEWGDPNNNGMPWEKGWVGNVMDSWDLLDELALPIENQELQDDILDSVQEQQWCINDLYSLSPEDVLNYGWKEFVNTVKHRSRYAFYRLEDDKTGRGYEEVPPNQFMDFLSQVIDSLGLYRSVKANSKFYRVRVHKPSEEVSCAEHIGTPKPEFACFPNRMSPSGIPMFYGAFDVKTALKETYEPDKNIRHVSLGSFTNCKELTFVDLSAAPRVPGLFSEHDRSTRHGLAFLHKFIEEISLPINKDGMEHLDYVPTQVISEHLRFLHEKVTGTEVHGLIYPSTKNNGEKAIVVFCDSTHCADAGNEDESSIFTLQNLKRINPSKYL
ncbi:MAG: HEPN-associated N-terminal domain-containing protein [Colwellia sp.]